jgi:hypothetical protein
MGSVVVVIHTISLPSFPLVIGFSLFLHGIALVLNVKET